MDTAIRFEHPVVNVNFFHWVRLKEEAGISIDDIECEPSSSLSFPVADFQRLNAGNTVVSFLSLLGPSSPLPYYLNSPYFSSDHEVEVYVAFMKILNMIFYRAWYAAWKAKHVYLFSVERCDAKKPWLLETHINRLPTDLGLRFLLHRFCADLSFIIQRVAHFIPVPKSCLANRSYVRLSDNVVLGCRIPSQEALIRILLGPMDNNEAFRWLPIYPQGRRLCETIKHYLGSEIQVSWAIDIAAQTSAVCLNGQFVLGANTFLGRSGQRSVIRFKY